MKAVVWTKYGPPEGLELQEIEKPSPKDNEILVKILATTVTAGDCEIRRLELPLMLSTPMRIYAGLNKPKRIKILGQELAGIIESVGSDVKNYKAGDEVFGTTGFKFGAYAEYICLPGTPKDAQGILTSKPESLPFEEAAVIPTAGLEALNFLRKADIQPGEKVLIIGAGGSIGTFTTQLAKYFGAEVTAVDGTPKMDFIRSLGADHTIDYIKEDYLNSGKTYDLIIDVVGREQVSQRLDLLKDNGYYFLAYANLRNALLSIRVPRRSNKNFKIESAIQREEDLRYLLKLIREGKIKPIIGQRFNLEEIPDAHRYAESGEKLGNIAIRVNK